jgi:hypothetical protein
MYLFYGYVIYYHHHLALQPYVSLGLLCYSPPLVSIVSFPSPCVTHYHLNFNGFSSYECHRFFYLFYIIKLFSLSYIHSQMYCFIII